MYRRGFRTSPSSRTDWLLLRRRPGAAGGDGGGGGEVLIVRLALQQQQHVVQCFSSRSSFDASWSSGSSTTSTTTAPSTTPAMIPPARIILVRHGESLGNVSEETYATTPDWKIQLTENGLEQARQAGRDLVSTLQQLRKNNNIEDDNETNPNEQQEQQQQSLLTYCSPYERTLQTWKEMQNELLLWNKHSTTTNTAAKIHLIGMRQEPRLAEQQFGNFQNPARVLSAKEERIDFGRFFYRFPNGESGLDVYSRVTSFLGSLSRDLQQLHQHQHSSSPSTMTRHSLTVLCVTHGLTLRLFLMRYFQLTVQEFEETYNPPNAHLILMQREFSPTTNMHYYRLTEESKQILNIRGDVSTEKPIFWRNRDDTDTENTDPGT